MKDSPRATDTHARTDEREHVVCARAVTKLYGERVAVDGIDFEVARGEAFGLLGPNGAGKSTTMRMVACRAPLSAGTLFVEGFDVRHDARRIRSLIGVVPQENNLDPDLGVRQNLTTYARFFRLPRERALARTDELLGFIGLRTRDSARVEELSGGMKRRLMIARALLHEPRLLVLDEPTTGLDPQVRQEIWQRLEELRRETQLTILISTHYMDEAERLCDRLLVIDRGRIVAQGTPRALVAEHFAPYALEVRDAADLPLLDNNDPESKVRAIERSGAHLYFALSPELLTPIMKRYEGRRTILRPSNLEDVFLEIVGDAPVEDSFDE
ncbi:MAG: lipooligosaccharide transport system ATP-binding protein [Acidobacteriota bacterium]|nr:lipooligosaccharide transport system ATP-binding protein [Acidobacteriota bacterium]